MNTKSEDVERLFGQTTDVDPSLKVSKEVLNGNVKIIFTHPEALLSTDGRKLMKTELFQKNVAACVVDEAHCVEIWYVQNTKCECTITMFIDLN